MKEKRKLVIPKFRSIQEEAEWWDKTDTSEFMEDLIFSPGGTVVLTEDRCPKCYSRRKLRRFNLRIANGRVTLHRVKGYHCPKCKTTSPARSVEQGIPRIEKAAQKLIT